MEVVPRRSRRGMEIRFLIFLFLGVSSEVWHPSSEEFIEHEEAQFWGSSEERPASSEWLQNSEEFIQHPQHHFLDSATDHEDRDHAFFNSRELLEDSEFIGEHGYSESKVKDSKDSLESQWQSLRKSNNPEEAGTKVKTNKNRSSVGKKSDDKYSRRNPKAGKKSHEEKKEKPLQPNPRSKSKKKNREKQPDKQSKSRSPSAKESGRVVPDIISKPRDKSSGTSPRSKKVPRQSDGRLSSVDCRRGPGSSIGFSPLCEYFGSRVGDEIVSGLESGGVVLGRGDEKTRGGGGGHEGGYDLGGSYEIQKPALARWLESACDYYYSPRSRNGYSCISRNPACLRQLAINPQPDFQIPRLRNYPRVLGCFDRVMKARGTFQRAKPMARELLKEGLLMDRWTRLESLGWATSKLRAWRLGYRRDEKSVARLRRTIGRVPKVADFCGTSNKVVERWWRLGGDGCLRKIVANLLVLENDLLKDGVSLGMVWLGGDSVVLNALQAVRSVLAEERPERVKDYLDRKEIEKILEKLVKVQGSRRSAPAKNPLQPGELADLLNGIMSDRYSHSLRGSKGDTHHRHEHKFEKSESPASNDRAMRESKRDREELSKKVVNMMDVELFVDMIKKALAKGGGKF